MTPRDRVIRARRWLAGALIVTALLRGATAAAAVLLLSTLVFSTRDSRLATMNWVLTFATIAGLAATAHRLRAGRRVLSLTSIALWVEERQPALAYALVTAVEPRWGASGPPPALAAAADTADLERLAVQAATRSIAIAAGVLLLVAIPLHFLDSRLATRDRGDGAASASAASRLTKLRASIASPAYSRLATRKLDEPSSVDALPGSLVTLSGEGGAAGVSIEQGGKLASAWSQGSGWAATITMPSAPAVLTLRDRNFTRLVVLEPRPDSLPFAFLLSPSSDTVWQAAPTGRLELSARLADDFGLAAAQFEFLVTTGSGESFETKSVTGARQPLNNARSATLTATLLLDSLRLGPGSVLSIRAVAWDNNDVGGPGQGVSETRTLRVAEPEDTSSAEALPPDVMEQTRLSQRVLNLKTDTLIGVRPHLGAAAAEEKSTDYADMQMAIRARVIEVIALMESADEEGSYPTAQSRLLRTASDDMNEARRLLLAVHPDGAIPHMRHALKLLDQVRTADRYYFRGRHRPELVDIERARGQGKESGHPSTLDPRPPVPDERDNLRTRIETAAALYPRAPGAALDSLTYVRVSALTSSPAVAADLKATLEQLRGGVALDSALAPVRRRLAGGSLEIAGPPEWSGGIAP